MGVIEVEGLHKQFRKLKGGRTIAVDGHASEASAWRVSRPGLASAPQAWDVSLGGRLYEPAFCDGHSGLERLCTHMPDCSIRSVWRMVQQAVDQLLGKLTLKDLLKTEPEMNAWRGGDGPALPAYSPHAP